MVIMDIFKTDNISFYYQGELIKKTKNMLKMRKNQFYYDD
jgi:hypothetical protein